MNLSLHRHRDLDLSEQHLLSCSGGGDCAGGRIGDALDYVLVHGAVSERCFPYRGEPVACVRACDDPALTVCIDHAFEIDPGTGELPIKRTLMAYGPLTFGIRSWFHFMVLVGFDRDPLDGRTVWILRNSWGPHWGEGGYARIKTPLDDVYGVHAVTGVRLMNRGIEQATSCRDADDDGYAAWGLGRARPPGCETERPARDCNDADPLAGPALASGACAPIEPEEPPPPEPPEPPRPTRTNGGGGSGGGATVLECLVLLAVTVAARRTIPALAGRDRASSRPTQSRCAATGESSPNRVRWISS